MGFYLVLPLHAMCGKEKPVLVKKKNLYEFAKNESKRELQQLVTKDILT